MSGFAPFVVTLLAVALLTTSSSAQTPRDVLVVGMEAEPPGLDPGQALGIHTLRVTAEIFETLVSCAAASASNYNNPEVDQLLVQARQTGDRARRVELYRRAQRLIVEDAPMVFVDHEVQVVATRAGVKGFRLHPSGFDLRVENVTKEYSWTR